jgi:hypothetical protein
MRRHRIIFLAAAITCAAGCPASRRDVESAKRSLYDADFATLYAATLEATRESYPNIQESAARGSIKTAWHVVTYGNTEDQLANPRTVAQGQGMVSPQQQAAQSAAGMPTRLAYKRFFVRFDISIQGGRPWRLKVIGFASEWEPGSAMPVELHGPARPQWLDGRTDALLYAIYKRIKPYAVPMKEEVNDRPAAVKKADPTAFTDVPPAAAKRLAALKDAVAGRDYAALRAQLADDVVWSLGGGTGADIAMATWQADPEPLEAMNKLLAGGCAGHAQRVTCPGGPPVPGAYQLVVVLRGDSWLVTSFVKGE